ncbi:fasciclin domain-containing protein [Nostoc sp. FACHB-133]|uniref:fasciclin domain-containing protein n=1 Tax=Nostoc sp. FACHB-133 TaxID=2692835 RepID=UPI0018EFB465|nr:fasciclin domain-containing protein [Nostoc sp. FACHB-133]
MEVPNTLLAAIKAAQEVDTFKINSPFTVFVPTDETFIELQASTIDVLLKGIPSSRKSQFCNCDVSK